MLDAISASVVQNSAWRSRWMIWVEIFAAFSPSFSQTARSIAGSRCACVPDRSAQLPDADAFLRLRQSFLRPPEFVEHQRQLQSERDRLGVNAVAAPNHRRHFESARLRGDRRPQSRPNLSPEFQHASVSWTARVVSRISDEVSPWCIQRAAGPTEEATFSRKAMTSWFVRFSISAISGMENRARFRISTASAFGIWPQLGHRLTRQRFDLQPDFELALVRPKFAHLRPGISIDHRRKIKAARENGKRFVHKKAPLRRTNR